MTQEQVTSEKLEKTIIFDLNGTEYGLPVNFVESIETSLPITRVPHEKSYIKGVINLRGKIIPVMDLRIRLEEQQDDSDNQNQIIITRMEDTQVGLIIDSAEDVLDIPVHFMEEPPETMETAKKEYIHSIVHLDDRLIILLNMYKLLHLEDAKLQETDDH